MDITFEERIEIELLCCKEKRREETQVTINNRRPGPAFKFSQRKEKEGIKEKGNYEVQ